mmetsp:Transcript_66545/g.128782  ORF Transcript_66545/g.128782 Transcript_66545/m.128782 type:complete len:97 (+) Transcript_66545:105-395(+)
MSQQQQMQMYYQALQQQQMQQQLQMQQQFQAGGALQNHPNYQHTYPMQQPQQKTMQFTLPADACPGRTYEFEADGRCLSFQVPMGYGPGMPITVSY